MKKSAVIEALSSFGDEFDTEQLIERLIVIDKVEQGLKDIREGRLHTFNEVKEKFADKWKK